jgi:molybdopterin synthase sulfur carrier subunit
MPVTVRGYLTLRPIIGEKFEVAITAGGMSLGELVEQLSEQFGEDLDRWLYTPGTREINKSSAILINGSHYTHLPDGLATQLQDGDEVALFPPLAGG